MEVIWYKCNLLLPMFKLQAFIVNPSVQDICIRNCGYTMGLSMEHNKFESVKLMNINRLTNSSNIWFNTDINKKRAAIAGSQTSQTFIKH